MRSTRQRGGAPQAISGMEVRLGHSLCGLPSFVCWTELGPRAREAEWKRRATIEYGAPLTKQGNRAAQIKAGLHACTKTRGELWNVHRISFVSHAAAVSMPGPAEEAVLRKAMPRHLAVKIGRAHV